MNKYQKALDEMVDVIEKNVYFEELYTWKTILQELINQHKEFNINDKVTVIANEKLGIFKDMINGIVIEITDSELWDYMKVYRVRFEDTTDVYYSHELRLDDE